MPSLHQLPAPAKVNLFLHVTGRRPDGYHLLQSVFVPIDWQDTLHIDTRDDGAIHRHDLLAPLPQDDLCTRAARLLQVESGVSMGCDIRIEKVLPSGAGLGGGSSDAATVLLALNQLWGLHWSTQRLADLAVRLGADVPFFVHGQPAWIEGIGEQITPIPLPADVLDSPLVVLKPPASVPTASIFTSPLLKRDTKPATLADFLAAPKRFGRNDLQEPAESWRACDEHVRNTPAGDGSQISLALGVMRNRFGNSRMTGSGSAVFSWLEPGQSLGSQSVTQAVDLGAHEGHWVGRVCRVLPCHPLLHLLDGFPASAR